MRVLRDVYTQFAISTQYGKEILSLRKIYVARYGKLYDINILYMHVPQCDRHGSRCMTVGLIQACH